MLTRICRLVMTVVLLPACAGTMRPLDRPSEPSSRAALAPGSLEIEVRVDPRVELMSVIFRLAEVPGYTMNHFQGYVDAIEAHFGTYRQHPAVLHARRLAAEHGVSWDAPMGMAVHLTDPPDLQLRMPSEDAALDTRWPRAETEMFAAHARAFAEAADFQGFFQRQRSLYELAEARMEETVGEHVDLEWFERFFRRLPDAPFTVLMGLSNGGASYYVRFAEPGRPEEIYAVIGAWLVDEEGLPVFNEQIVSTIVHELVHAYVNPLVDAHSEALRPAGEVIFAAVEAPMKGQSYGRWDIVLKESLVRAAVARYVLAQQGPAAASSEIAPQFERGFFWTDELYAVLGIYEHAPDRYGSFPAFVPNLIAYFEDLAPRATNKVEQYDARRPRLLSMSIPDAAENVDPSLSEITFHFDRPMDRRHHPLVTQGPDGQAHFPGSAAPRFDAAGMVLTLPVSLRPNWTYRFTLGFPTGGGFMDTHGVSMKPVEVRFSTGPPRD